MPAALHGYPRMVASSLGRSVGRRVRIIGAASVGGGVVVVAYMQAAPDSMRSCYPGCCY
jgi:hypothetical protein